VPAGRRWIQRAGSGGPGCFIVFEHANGKALTGWTNSGKTVVVTSRFFDNRGSLQAESVPHFVSTGYDNPRPL
jgi:hypothetical protein